MADELADPGPGDAAKVEQRDASVSEVVRRKGGDASRGAGAGNRSAEAIAAEALEDGPVRNAVLAPRTRSPPTSPISFTSAIGTVSREAISALRLTT